MRQDVMHAASCGAHGVVLGMLTPGGAIDQDQLRPFADLCLALGGGAAGASLVRVVQQQRVVQWQRVAHLPGWRRSK